MKKKLVLVLLIAALLALLCACASPAAPAPAQPETNEEAPEPPAAETESPAATVETQVTESVFDEALDAQWRELFHAGGEGVSESGRSCFLAFDSLDELTHAAQFVLSPDQSEVLSFVSGSVALEDGWYVIKGDDSASCIPFRFSETAVEDGFELLFQDGDSVMMSEVDGDTIILDMLSIYESKKG